MVPSQKDVVADYLNDMFGVTTPSAEQKKTNQDDDSSADKSDLSVSDSKSASVSSDKNSAESASVKPNAQVDISSTATKVKDGTVLNPLEISVEGLDIDWTPEFSNELDKLSYEIDRDKQLSCLVDLVHRPLPSMSDGELSLAMLELLALLKQLPESRLKEILRAQYDKVAHAKKHENIDCVSA
ncbi:hypothetical protein [Litoribrevibacter albus]|uniref:Uncharacterized protein n=1 Tax=Litoribrevibacter albus TaxID=1473156 RepID=A0AA37SCH5_9GAMM|nr:hypothetical protein [Litoribrevibacter albus]GLQ32363.1 hypothetical protein GCM10007876_28420 [Litoribrevibacter albus]